MISKNLANSISEAIADVTLKETYAIEYSATKALEYAIAAWGSYTTGLMSGTRVQYDWKSRQYPGGVSRMNRMFSRTPLSDIYATQRKQLQFPYIDHTGFLSSSLSAPVMYYQGGVGEVKIVKSHWNHPKRDYFNAVNEYVQRSTGYDIYDYYAKQAESFDVESVFVGAFEDWFDYTQETTKDWRAALRRTDKNHKIIKSSL